MTFGKVNSFTKAVIGLGVISLLVSLSWAAKPTLALFSRPSANVLLPDSPDVPTDTMPYRIRDKKTNKGYYNGMDLKDPASITTTYELDSSGQFYIKKEKIGNVVLSTETLTLKEYLEQKGSQSNRDYFKQRSKAQNFVRGGGLIPSLKINSKTFESIFGSGLVEIKPTGTAELTFGGNFNTVRNPAFTARQQKTGQFDFKQKIQLNLTGNIGDKFKINTNYNTEALFDFENQMKLDWAGKEDDIVKKVEVGNVSLPLNGTLIQGSQSLFGFKTALQFGRLTVTSIFSQAKGKTTETEIQGGVQITPFDIQCDQYDQNRHYFLSQYFREHYEEWLSRPPLVQSPIIINRVEVWVTNRTQAFDNARDILGFMDLGEYNPYNKNMLIGSPNVPYPDNNTNNLISLLRANPKYRSSFECVNTLEQNTQFKQIDDYQILNFARQLSAQEFTFHPRLGYISLNTALNNDEVLAVAFEYSVNGKTYQVGEFSRDVAPDQTKPNVLFLKLLKPVSIRPDLPSWDLMMKNVYSLGTYSIQSKDFKLRIDYADDPSGADLPYIPAQKEPNLIGLPLIKVLNLDRINVQQEPTPDGQFDYIEGITVNSQQGRIIFPVLEPFGSYLKKQFADTNTANYYVFQALYDSTRWAAQQQALKNKFFIRGSFQGQSSSEISLNSINVPKGSVKVTANGQPLTEGTDYTVDYTLGKVKILNSGILSSGAVIKVSSENNTLFNIQQKTLYGSRLDFKVNKDFILGGTVLHLRERPLTPKVNIGDEPLANTIIGFDGTYKTESRWITKMVDKLPFLETKEKSSFMASGEFAKIFPGVANSISKTLDKKGVSYVDDFEGSETPYDLRLGNYWVLASTPQGQPDNFPESLFGNSLKSRDHVARLGFYTLDPLFYRNDNLTPTHIKNDLNAQSNHYVREVLITEVFPNKQIQQGLPGTLPTFDMSYFPNQRGPYNFNVSGLNADGTFSDPTKNWAGVMRKIETNDFELANIDYIEIWMMDPFIKGSNPNPNNSGQLYINLGNISEDVLKDGRKSFENGMDPTGGNAHTDTTIWGKVPNIPAINNAFNNDPTSRIKQDIGLDGLDDKDEIVFYDTILAQVKNQFGVNSIAYQTLLQDPANDNYHYYRGSDYDQEKVPIIQRYKHLNGPDGNSPTTEQTPPHQPKETYPVGIQQYPNDEDINRDFTLNEIEEYYQYRIDIDPSRLVVGQNYVTDSISVDVTLRNKKVERITWYQLKVPIRSFERKVGNIPDFKSIRFMRMYMKGFSDSITLRFGQLQLIRADWRKYLFSLEKPTDTNPVDVKDQTSFVVSTVNIEENGKRTPVPYMLPPGIFRTIDPSNPQPIQNNEQSLSLRVCGLNDGDARAVFKNTRFDIRNYKRLKMFVHAEAFKDVPLNDGDLSAFIRIGTDFTNNYYEYEIPLKLTPFGSRDENQIWPAVNDLDVSIDTFYLLKQLRLQQSGSLTIPFSMSLPNGGKVSVLGIPDMSNLRVIMLGIRNPLKTGSTPKDDGLPKCGEVWFDELRVSDFENPGGWAAIGRMTTKLADFGTINVSGNITTFGFGGLDKKLNDRARSNTYGFDANGNFEMGKFFPAKANVSIPMYIGYNQTVVRPYFYPLNPDLSLKSILSFAPDEQTRTHIKQAAEDFTSRYSFNLTNIRKNRGTSQKIHPWDIENFNATYAYTSTFKRNQFVEYNLIKTYKVQVAYNYQFNSKSHTPFKNIGKSKYLQLIKDFNFTLFPQSLTVRYDLDRKYSELLNRNNDNQNTFIQTFYDKNFTMTRFYDLKWDLTKSLKLDYNANVQARIDEPTGLISKETPEKRDSIIGNLKRLGRTTNFSQVVNLNYTVPFSKFPLTNWITLSGRYSANYDWKTAPPALKDTVGSQLQNSQNVSITGQLNFVQLYNKIKFLENINKGLGIRKVPHKEDPNKKPKEEKDPKNKNPKLIPGQEEKQDNKDDKYTGAGPKALELFLKMLMTLRNVNFSYTETNGTLLPGYLPKPKYLGMNWEQMAPGFDFILGSQDPNIRYRAGRNGWITTDPLVNSFFMSNHSSQFTGKATLEPFTDFRIELNFTRNQTRNYQSTFRFDTTNGFNDWRDLSGVENGNFTMTYNVYRTAFKKNSIDNSEVWDQFLNNRFNVAMALQESNENPKNRNRGIDPTTNYPTGYSKTQQDVLINSFLQTYAGANPEKLNKLDIMPKIPRPSWRINYNGLTKIPAVKKWAQNLSISHAYTSTYTLGNFIQSVQYSADTVSRFGSDLRPKYEIKQVSISERFAPLIGIDLTTTNNISFKVEYKTDRTLTMVLNNPQLTEISNKEFVIGAGYRTKEMALPFKIDGKRAILENDINFRLDFSIKDSRTVIRKLDGPSLPTAGSKILSIRPTIDYMASDKVNVRLFYDRRVTTPYTSNSFPTAITQFGVTVRYTLQ